MELQIVVQVEFGFFALKTLRLTPHFVRYCPFFLPLRLFTVNLKNSPDALSQR